MFSQLGYPDNTIATDEGIGQKLAKALSPKERTTSSLPADRHMT